MKIFGLFLSIKVVVKNQSRNGNGLWEEWTKSACKVNCNSWVPQEVFAKLLSPKIRSKDSELITAGTLILNEFTKPHKTAVLSDLYNCGL